MNHPGFAAALAAPGIRVVSFDVFDTALVRTFARAVDLFAELGRALHGQQLITVTPERFAHLRVQAEAAARRRRADTEPGLGEIYVELATRLGWSEPQRTTAEQAEIELELRAMAAVPAVSGWIQAARVAGKTVAFVSDMYLPAPVIRAMLTRHGLVQPHEAVLVSCEYRATKFDGALFDRLIETTGCRAGQILHVGDNPRSDGTSPRAKGLLTFEVTEARLDFFEQRFLAYQHDTGGLSGRLAATSRLARLTCGPDGPAPALSEIGTGLLGPWLAAFALWTFGRARRAGIKRLYFVSRDGQVMRELALAVQQRWPDAAGIECRYLHGSRIAWHHAAMTELGDHQLRWLLNPQPRVNADILADRLGVPRERVTTLLAPTAGHLVAQPAWGPAEIACVDDILRRKSAEIVAWPEVVARRALAHRYFAQEGLLQDSAWAVVELGWSGSMMVSLYEALGRPAALRAYYLNLSSVCPDLPAAVHLEVFAINPDDVSGHLGRGLRFAEMIEVLTAADHGTVLGYETRDGRIAPRLKQDSAALWPVAALTALRTGATEFVAQMPAEVMTRLAAQLAGEATARILVHQLLLVLADFLRTPPPALARAFTACRFTEDPTDHDQRGFVQPLKFWPVWRHGWKRDEELWAEGTLACSPPVAAALARDGLAAALAQLWRGAWRRLAPAR